MLIRMRCEMCNQKIKTASDFVGSRIKCPSCGNKVLVEDPAVFVEDEQPKSENPVADIEMESLFEKRSKSTNVDSSRSMPQLNSNHIALVVIGLFLFAAVYALMGRSDGEGENSQSGEQADKKELSFDYVASITKLSRERNKDYKLAVAESWYLTDFPGLSNWEDKTLASYVVLLDNPMYYDPQVKEELSLRFGDGSVYYPSNYGHPGAGKPNCAVSALKNVDIETGHFPNASKSVIGLVFWLPENKRGVARLRAVGQDAELTITDSVKSFTSEYINNLAEGDIGQYIFDNHIENALYAPLAGKVVIKHVGKSGLDVYDTRGKARGHIKVPDPRALFTVCGRKLLIFEGATKLFRLYDLKTVEKLKEFPSPLAVDIQFVNGGTLNGNYVFIAALLQRGRIYTVYNGLLNLHSGLMENTRHDFVQGGGELESLGDFVTAYRYYADPSLRTIFEVNNEAECYRIAQDEHGDWQRKLLGDKTIQHLARAGNNRFVPMLGGSCSIYGAEVYDDAFRISRYPADIIVPDVYSDYIVGVDKSSGEMEIFDRLSTRSLMSLGKLSDETILKEDGSYTRVSATKSGKRQFSSRSINRKYLNMPEVERRILYDSRADMLLIFPKDEAKMVYMKCDLGNAALVKPALSMPGRPVGRYIPGAAWDYRIDAISDCRDLTYKVIKGPTAMSVTALGVIHWTVPQSQQGKVEAVVLVEGRVNGSVESVYHSFDLLPGALADKPQDWALGINNDLKKVKGLVVTEIRGGEYLGQALDIIVTADKSETVDDYSIKFARDKAIGPSMQDSLDEVIRLMSNTGSVQLKNYEITISFADKYTGKDGGSASAAFALMLFSIAENFEIDPALALTGDLTVDGTVRRIGGVAAKLKGAIRAGCTTVIVPSENSIDVMDMGMLGNEEDMQKISIFTAETMRDVVAIGRLDKDVKIIKAVEEYAALMTAVGDGEVSLDGRVAEGKLTRILDRCPNHLSAKYFLDKLRNESPKQLSIDGAYSQIGLLIQKYLIHLSDDGMIGAEVFSKDSLNASMKKCTFLMKVSDETLLSSVSELRNWIKQVHEYADAQDYLRRMRGSKRESGAIGRVAREQQALNVVANKLSQELQALGTNLELLEKRLTE